MPQANVTILGAGSIGTAIATLLAANRYKVTLWDIEPEVVRGINQFHKNPRSMPDFQLDKSISAQKDLSKAVFGADMVVFAVSSGAVREVAQDSVDSMARNCVIVSVAKGLEDSTLKTMSEVIRESVGGQFRYQIAVLSGPTLARDIIAQKPMAAMLASERSNTCINRAIGAFSNDWFRVYETRDVLGVSLCGVAKNALAISSGIMAGLSYSPNTYAWILTEGFREMARLIWKLGGQEETVYGIAGLGDALATCFSQTSRNRMFGELVGKGKSVAHALESVKETVEGAGAIDALHKIALNEKLNLPVLRSLYEVVSQKKSAKKIFEELTRNL